MDGGLVWTSWTSDIVYYNLDGHDGNAGESTSVSSKSAMSYLQQLLDDANLDWYTLNSMSTKRRGRY